MNIGQAFQLSIKSIISNRMRSFLTMLGMIIGVGSVITLIGLMEGVTNYTLGQFEDFGTNVVSVSVKNTATRYVETEDMFTLVKDNPDILTGVSPSVMSSYMVKNGNESLTTTVYGVGEDHFDINRLKVSAGRFIQYSDVVTRHNSCVIGSYIADELYDGNVTMGDTIKINGQLYNIVGIQEEKSDSEEASSDDCIFIPYSNAARMAKNAKISVFSFAAKTVELVPQAEIILKEYLYSVMKDSDLYRVSSLTELLEMIESTMGMMSTALSGIAGISLLVAGIGIMNIMLVSVVERTKEIGIRKSLGAKKKDIMRQFVIEAAMISSLGGLLGIILGSFGTIQLGNLLELEAVPTLNAILLSFGVSAAIGMGFGYMPANKAAKLNPIDALRSE